MNLRIFTFHTALSVSFFFAWWHYIEVVQNSKCQKLLKYVNCSAINDAYILKKLYENIDDFAYQQYAFKINSGKINSITPIIRQVMHCPYTPGIAAMISQL